ncbi:MAG: cupin domain-containing protein [Deltaproteobacteria bacterium]|nr:cupin domain-containing protein [Deltaproteobacteria bacterium]
MAKPIRRIVTGHNAAGKSIIAQDAIATSVLELPSAPGLRVTDLWETITAPADLSGGTDPVARPVHLEPKPTGTICRVVELPPDAALGKQADSREMFASLGASHVADTSSSTPMMHKTASVDYAIVLSGEIWAVMDEGETCMKAGDVLIQCATNHAWSNRSNEPAFVAFILVGAVPVA